MNRIKRNFVAEVLKIKKKEWGETRNIFVLLDYLNGLGTSASDQKS